MKRLRCPSAGPVCQAARWPTREGRFRPFGAVTHSLSAYAPRVVRSGNISASDKPDFRASLEAAGEGRFRDAGDAVRPWHWRPTNPV